MKKNVFIVGAGGCARETLDIYIDLQREADVLGFVEENCQKEGQLLNGKPTYDISSLNDLKIKNNDFSLIGAMGSTKRKHLLEQLEKAGFSFDTLIHPSAIRSRWVEFGEGSIVAPGVIMTCQIKVGRHAIINFGSRIGHDVDIGDFSTISPGAAVMGFSRLGEQVFVGANATITDHVAVGRGCVIAAGSVVTKDVPDMSLVAGVPGVIKKVYKDEDDKPW
jgi:sugar O-acyltransferase (sialic acid O-acetyltransferase NeuD family)